jgi:hypothetical protein
MIAAVCGVGKARRAAYPERMSSRVSRSVVPAGLAALLLLASCRGAPAAAEALHPAPLVDFGEVLRLSEAYWYMRYAPLQETRAALGPSYDELAVVDIPATANRYMIGTLAANRRQEIWIRGTANRENAIADMQIAKRRNVKLGINLHRGFEEMAMAVYQDIQPRLTPGFELVIFGHSLGAAEATILGLLLQADGWRVSRVYASGCPRLTDAAGAAAFARLPLVRVVNEGDPVPVLPPRTLVSPLDPYVHIGDAIVLLDGPYWCVLEEQAGPDPLAEDLWRSLRTNTLAGDVKEHFIASYLDRLRPKAVQAIEVPSADRARYLGLP